MGTYSNFNLPFGWSREQYDTYQRENIRFLGRFGPSENEYDVARAIPGLSLMPQAVTLHTDMECCQKAPVLLGEHKPVNVYDVGRLLELVQCQVVASASSVRGG
jgi:hypothetical protein